MGCSLRLKRLLEYISAWIFLQSHYTLYNFILYSILMSVLVYNGEKFSRGKTRYLVFVVVVASVFLLSILNNNIVGGVLIFFLLWWYFYYSTINSQVVKMVIQKNQLVIGNKVFPWNTFVGYVLEIHSKTQEVKNIVLLTQKWHMIHTFDDSVEHINAFVNELDAYLPMLDNYNQTALERFSRKMKL